MKKKQKILYIITKSNLGGAQRYVFSLSTSLKKDNFDVVVAFGGTGKKGAEGGLLSTLLGEKKIKTIFVKHFMREVSVFSEFFVLFELIQILKTEKPDILHLNSSKAGFLGALAGRIVGTKNIIFTVHGWPFREKSRGIIFTCIAFLGSWVTSILSHKVILVSHADKMYSKKMPFVQHKFTVIHNGIEDIDFLEKRKAREVLKGITPFIPDVSTWIGVIAELNKNKGISYLIKACSKLKDTTKSFSVILIGAGDEKERLLKLVEEKKLTENVFFLNFIPNAYKYLETFDIFVLPSLKEGLPYVLLEAGQAGLPVIASNVGGIPEIVEDRKTGILTKPRDVEAIHTALKNLINNKRKRQELGDNLHKKVVNSFTLKKMVEKTMEVYEKQSV